MFVIVVITLLCLHGGGVQAQSLPFYSLGTTNGIVPALLPTDNDISSDPIIVTGGFRFGDILHTTAYVNENGVISFGREFRFPTPSLFPLELSRDAFIVAPFWTDVDIRSGGEIRYEVHQTNNPQSVELLQEVSSFISSQRGSDFDGTWMLVAQWDHVYQYESLMYFDDDVSGFYQDYYYIERDEVIPANNTYQAIVITDGSQSFAVFTYNCGELEWSGNATIGYYAAGQLYDSHPLSGTEEAKNIACLNSPWTNIVYPLTPPEEAGPLPPPADGVVLGTCTAASFEHCCPTQLRFCVGEPPDCFCDQQCYMFGDCCVDIEDVCRNVTDFLFPYGEDVGDSQVPPSDDGSSLPIQMSILIFGSTETMLFVNANGVISFEYPFYRYSPEAFPFDSVPLIAPFWDDVNILRYGRIYYRQTDDVPSLGMAHDFIANGFPAEAETFFPTVLFIATWDRVAEFSSELQENTFQVVLATDGVMSFVFFLYGDIQWGTANIGFNTGDNVGFYMVPGALTPFSRSIGSSSNVDVTGLYIFRTDLPLIFPHGIRFQQAVYDVDEDSGAVSICAETTYDGQLGAVLILSSQEVTADEGDDYDRIRRDVRFDAYNTEVCVSISILNDITPEDTETFSIAVTTEMPVFSVATTTVNILDDDAAVVTFERSVYVLEEYTGTTLACTRPAGQLERDTTVVVFSVDNTAISGSDYTEIAENITGTINAAGTRFCVNVSVVNDNANEEVEYFSLMLVGDGMTAETTIVILDDDTTDFVLVKPNYVFQENVGNVSLCAISTGELGRDVNITVSFSDSAAKNGSDYIGIPQVLMFDASNTKLCVDIPILDNLANENVESFAVILSGTAETALGSAVDIICGEMSSSNTTTTDLIVLYSAYVTIEDDDAVEVGFEYPVYIVSESSGSVTVCVLTNTLLEGSDVDVTLSTSDVTAEADSDYSRKSQVLSFTPRDLSNCINIGILTSYGTLAAEDAEIFHINFTSAEVSLFRQSVTVVILDSHSFFPHEDGEVIVNGTDLEEYHSPPINLSQPFPLLGSSENTVYVNSNGVLSFQQPFTDSVRDFPFVGPPLIAPFWSDVHNTDHGTISTRETNDAALVERVHNHVHAAFPSEEDFIPTLLFIVTWEHDGKMALMERSTFQTVLATDGVKSFVVFIYGDIMWSRITMAGFNAGDGNGHFEVLEERQSSSDIERGSNFGIPGIYVYRTDLPEVMSMDSCSDGEIRTGSGLGTYPTMGDVEICFNSTWRRVCGDSWEDTDASVACRELGFPSGAASQASIPEGSVVYQLDINCNGQEERLFECFNNSLGPEDSGILLPEMGSAEEASNSPGSGSASGGGDDQNPTESCLSYATVNCTALTVAFDDVSYSVGEGDGTLNICFSLSQPLTRSVNVTMTTVYTGSAQDGVDYTATTVQLTFLPSTNEQCADIPIVNDETVESNETLLVILTTSDPAVSMDTNYAYIKITDDDTLLITSATTFLGAPSFPSVTPSATQTPMIPATTDSSTDDVAALASGLSVAIVIVLLLLIVGAALLFYYKRRKRVARKVQQESRDWSGENETSFIQRALAEDGYGVNPYTRFLKSRMATLKEKGYLEKLTADMIIPSTNLRLLDCIGQGEFGIVYKAHLVRSKPTTTTGSRRSSVIGSRKCSLLPEAVAVKTLKGFYDQDQIDEMMRESIKMREFDHPNVLSLIGVCIDAGPAPYIVTPFMLNGSLVSYLKKERSNLIVDQDADEEMLCNTRKRLLDMCLQIAKGMEYLAARNFIHRDLASRNCMIDYDFVIKVADFGLSENTYVKNYFRQGSGSSVKLPIKWMALDSLTDGVFSEKTDVWSFGVTCWEVFSGGKTPYPGVDPISLIGMLENGHRMEKPRNAACSDEMYTLMLNCWKPEPEERPTFTDLSATISSTLGYMSDYLDISTIACVHVNPTAVEEEMKHEADRGSSEGGSDNCATSGRENGPT